MKLIFVYRNGRKFVAKNVIDILAITGGGNVTQIQYVRNMDFESFQNKGEENLCDKENGLRINRAGMERWQEAHETVTVFVNKAQLSYVIVEESLQDTNLVPLFSDVSNRKALTIIPCLDSYTGENLRDVLKTIS